MFTRKSVSVVLDRGRECASERERERVCVSLTERVCACSDNHHFCWHIQLLRLALRVCLRVGVRAGVRVGVRVGSRKTKSLISSIFSRK